MVIRAIIKRGVDSVLEENMDHIIITPGHNAFRFVKPFIKI